MARRHMLCVALVFTRCQVFLTYVPQYLVTQQGFDLESAGLLGSLPFLASP